jgi:large subunit ribosomal protein L2
MGKRLNQQRRGAGKPPFTAPSHRYVADITYRNYDERERSSCITGEVIKLLDDPSRTTLLMKVRADDNKCYLMLAPEGIAIGDTVKFGMKADLAIGNVLPLAAVPDGTPIFNIELEPGDGGKIVRSAGSAAYVVSHLGDQVIVSLPSKAVKYLSSACRAQIGIPAGGGHKEKPIFKAGKAFHMYKSKSYYWPHVRGVAMNAVDHPFGGSQHHPGRSTIASKGAPPGSKVGLIGAASVGRKKGKKKAVTETTSR